MPLILVVAFLLKLTKLLNIPDEFEITRMIELNQDEGTFTARGRVRCLNCHTTLFLIYCDLMDPGYIMLYS
jgi:hypothetical protein